MCISLRVKEAMSGVIAMCNAIRTHAEMRLKTFLPDLNYRAELWDLWDAANLLKRVSLESEDEMCFSLRNVCPAFPSRFDEPRIVIDYCNGIVAWIAEYNSEASNLYSEVLEEYNPV